MVGKYDVTVTTRRDVVKFTVKRKYTILRGDSGTGKSLLFDIVRQKNLRPELPNIKISSDIPVVTVSGRESYTDLGKSIVIIDEDTLEKFKEMDGMKGFAEGTKTCDSYFILISRFSMSAIPYSALEIYNLESEKVGKRLFYSFRQEYLLNEI